MPHAIVAIVTGDKIDKEKAEQYDLPLNFENGFTIIGLDCAHSEYWAKKFNIYDDNSDFYGYPNGVFINITVRLASEIGITKFALIATDYFGGNGIQSSRIFEDEKEIYLENYNEDEYLFRGVEINQALNYIGVKKKKNTDEFDTINLSNYRSFETHYRSYE